MLFPFRFKTWLKIGFIGWLAGAGSGSFNLNVPSSSGHGGGGSASVGQNVEQTIRAFLNEHLVLIVLIVAIAILIGFGFLYLSAAFASFFSIRFCRRIPRSAAAGDAMSPRHTATSVF